MDVDEEEFLIEIGAGQIQQKGAEGEIDLGLVLLMELGNELPVCFVLALRLVVLAQLSRTRTLRIQNLLAEEFGVVEQVGLVLVPMLRIVFGQQAVIREPLF